MTVLTNLAKINKLANSEYEITVENARLLIRLVASTFRQHLVENGFDRRQITRLTTKLRDAGRRSPPWKTHSSRIPGRPQDGADGNRTNRWLLDPEHKFYSSEVMATLVEVKYYLQCFSMLNTPKLPSESIKTCFGFMMEHDVEPGKYFDPIQMTQIDIKEVLNDARIIQSGHLTPLDRDGKHIPSNTFLMLKRSNQLQGNLTVTELLDLMQGILNSHKRI